MTDDFMSASISRHADDVIRDQKISTLPIDLSTLCKKLNIALHPMTNGNGPSGMLIYDQDNFVIAYAANTGNEGFERFCIAHELGHFHLPGHIEALFKTGTTHESKAGFISDAKYEREADIFAASLLMPKEIFKKAIPGTNSGIASLQKLADQFKTSLLATAIRYTSFTDDPTVMIVSSNNRVSYCCMSASFKEIKGLTWIRKNSPLSSSTATSQFHQNPVKITAGQVEESSSDLSEWFDSKNAIEVNEDVVGLGKTGQTLTLLYGIELPDEDDVDEEELNESWTPRFRR